MSSAVKIFGSFGITERPGRRDSMSQNEIVTTIPFGGPYAVCQAWLPTLGSSVPGLESYGRVTGVELTRVEGGLGEIELTFRKENGGGGDDDESEDPDPIYSVRMVQQSMPLEMNKFFKDKIGMALTYTKSDVGEKDFKRIFGENTPGEQIEISAVTVIAKMKQADLLSRDILANRCSDSGGGKEFLKKFFDKYDKVGPTFRVAVPVATKTSDTKKQQTPSGLNEISGPPPGFGGLLPNQPDGTAFKYQKDQDDVTRTGRYARYQRVESWTGAADFDQDLYG